MITVNIIGTGRVGRTFMRLLQQTDFEMAGVAHRDFDKAAQAVMTMGIGQAFAIDDLPAADLWLLTVPDDAIASVARQIASHSPSIAVHCSGFLSSESLAPLSEAGWAVASCHPVLSFADPDSAARKFAGTMCAVEGDDAAIPVVKAFVAAIGGSTFPVLAERKSIYHAAAVISNNFATILQGLAHEAWADAGVPHDVAVKLGRSLLDATADNVARLGPQDALTGPAARGDKAVMDRQQADVARWYPQAGEVYRLLSDMGVQLKKTGRTR